MAFLTFILEDAGHLVAVSDGSGFPGPGSAGDQAAFYRRRRLGHLLAGQHFLDGLGQIVAFRLRPLVADAELIVDPALIANDALAIEDDRFGRAPRAHAIRRHMAFIAQYGEWQAV